MNERQKLEAAVAVLEAQRELVGDAVTEAALAPVRSRLARMRERDQVLRQVTILFMDVVGSTALGQRLDPEDMHQVMDGVLARATSIVRSRQGRVLQYAGDSLLAVFGADQAREDDPERAIKVGLALIDEGRRWGEQVRRQYGHLGFDVRVGIHTGGVLLGGGVDSEGNVRGVNVHIAARMEQTAPAGGLQISHDTYQHVRGLFEIETREALQIKGVDAPVQAHLVTRANPRAFRPASRGIQGVETNMVGRDAELDALQQSLDRACRERILLGVTVIADAGMGKSRLLNEFENLPEIRAGAFHVFRGKGASETRDQPYGLLRDVLSWRLSIADSDSMALAKNKVEQVLVPLLQADDGADVAQGHAHFLGHLIGLDFGDSKHVEGVLGNAKQIRDRGFHAAAQMFRRAQAQDNAAVILILDDVHWADEGSLDFLTYLAQANRDVSMLVLAFSRPTLLERRPDWFRDERHHRRIDLPPLGKGDSWALANELLKRLPNIPDTLRDLLTVGAEGNPYYMEELLKMLIDERAIETEGDHWRVHDDRLQATHVPQTLTGVLQARLDSLTAPERLALQQASIIGTVFWDQALAAIDEHGPESLPGITRRHFVTPNDHSSLEGAGEYAFRHQILHHVTYDTVLKLERRR